MFEFMGKPTTSRTTVVSGLSKTQSKARPSPSPAARPRLLTPGSGRSTPLPSSSPGKLRSGLGKHGSAAASASSSAKSSPRQSSRAASERPRKHEARVLPESDSDGDGDVKRRKIDVDEGRAVFQLPAGPDAWRGGVWAAQVKARTEAEGKVKYVPYDETPSVELLYPSGFRERFPLLVPTKAGEYNPVAELKHTLRLILAHYIPPSHAAIFGRLDDADAALPSRPASPPYTPPPGPGSATSSPAPLDLDTSTIGEALRRALAPNRKRGPELLSAMDRFNRAMEDLRAGEGWRAWMAERKLGGREWAELVEFVNDSVVTRIVSPYVEQLAPKRTDELADIIRDKEDSYGELRHVFMTRIIEQTKLGPGKVFVDLGSGVGNCVLQSAVQTGARSYGCELLPVPSHCARLQVDECRRRWAIWCLRYERDVEVHEGDFRRHADVARRLQEADVVLVNNEVFSSGLNVDLQNMFLDLKEGAVIVSLKPFGQVNFKINDANCDSFAAILRTTEHTYHPGWVSWKGESGTYFVQVIDRARRRKWDEQGRRRR